MTLTKSQIAKILNALLDEETVACGIQQETNNPLLGEYVIVRAKDAGVHAGYREYHDGRTVFLSKSRRLYYWMTAGNSASLSDVAINGLSEKSQIMPEVAHIQILDACEIICTTKKSKDSIVGIKDYER